MPKRDIMIELYDSSNNKVGWWASSWNGVKVIPASNLLMGLHDDGATIPSHYQYSALLVDNYDTQGTGSTYTTHRHYASTVWDGHAPVERADYIAGMPVGSYSIEAFVTGYIMDPMDAFQRTFTLPASGNNITYSLQMDLRRSNWLEPVIYASAVSTDKPGSTLVLTASDAAGNERAAMLMNVTKAMGADGKLDGKDASSQTMSAAEVWGAGKKPGYIGGIVIEGWNSLVPNGDWESLNDPAQKDYGLNPTASSHTVGTVSLAGNPYEVKMWFTDMGDPFGHYGAGAATYPQLHVTGNGWYTIDGTVIASVMLCNSRVQFSFKTNVAYVWISLRSVDFEIPAHSRPWSFPGAEVYVDFMGADGTIVDRADTPLSAN